MKIFATKDIKDIDAATCEEQGISSYDLMERAAQALTKEIAQRWSDKQTRFVAFAGSGNNGGDALAVARMLIEKGYHVETYLFNISGSMSPDCEMNRDLLNEMAASTLTEVTKQFNPPTLTEDDVVIDGLFGSGLNRPLAGGFAAVVRYINASKAQVVSIDIPSGLMGENNTGNDPDGIVRADVTLSIQLPKLSFLFPENEKYLGSWSLVDIGLSQDAIDSKYTDYSIADEDEMPWLLKVRGKFDHKGMFGRALLVAGSEGMAGASVLAAKSCLRSGVGLLTVHVPRCNNTIVQVSVPEAMTDIDSGETHLTRVPQNISMFTAIGVGPGLGQDVETRSALYELINASKVPMVLDADALNMIGENHSYLQRLTHGSIITPHPGEMDRLVGRCHDSYERLMKARELASKCDVYVVLKGAYTAVLSPDGSCWFNNTGNPGMATGGSGDALTGIILALLAQGYEAETAARLGVYVHGLAGDIAARKTGEMGLTAGELVDSLPLAWLVLEKA